MRQFDIVIVGGGYAGVMCALRLAGRLRDRSTIALVNPRPDFVERLRLHETLVETRHLARELYLPEFLDRRGVAFIEGTVKSIDRDKGGISIAPLSGEMEQIGYRHLVIASGSIVSRAACPGLAEHGFVMEAGVPNGPESPRTALANCRDGAELNSTDVRMSNAARRDGIG